MFIALTIATLFVVVVTLLPILKCTHWTVRVMDFPRVQIAFCAALTLMLQFCVLPSQPILTALFILLTALCLLWQLWWVVPYTRLWPIEAKACKTQDVNKQLSIMTSNVLQTNRNSDALIEIVNDYKPDILVTLESDTWWESRLSVLSAHMPYSVKCPLDNLYGMHVYSRLPFSDSVISYLVEDDVPSIHLLLELRTGDKVQMHFVHPAPPSPTENTESAERDAELIVIAKRVAQTQQAVVVTGDLNDVAWSTSTRLFRKISGLLDPRIGRGMFNTFHVKYPFLRWPLDHLFHSSHFTVKAIKRLPSIGSDHFPLLTVLVFDPESSADQEGLTADRDDHIEANKTAQAEQVSEADVPALSG